MPRHGPDTGLTIKAATSWESQDQVLALTVTHRVTWMVAQDHVHYKDTMSGSGVDGKTSGKVAEEAIRVR